MHFRDVSSITIGSMLHGLIFSSCSILSQVHAISSGDVSHANIFRRSLKCSIESRDQIPSNTHFSLIIYPECPDSIPHIMFPNHINQICLGMDASISILRIYPMHKHITNIKCDSKRTSKKCNVPTNGRGRCDYCVEE